MAVGGRVDVAVEIAVGVTVGVLLGVGDSVNIAVAVNATLEGSPSTVNLPETFHCCPTKICTSYSPGFHSKGFGFQSVYP